MGQHDFSGWRATNPFASRSIWEKEPKRSSLSSIGLSGIVHPLRGSPLPQEINKWPRELPERAT